jgi:hypothetical protein
MRHFCSYFDINYLPRGLALHRSLAAFYAEFRLYILCMDTATAVRLQDAALPEVRVVTLDQLESFEPALLTVKETRTVVEYYYTCGPSFIRYVLAMFPEADLITYLDADLYFFSSPEPLFALLGDGSVGLIEHRFSPRFQKRLQYGRFNVGWLSFRRGEAGEAALSWWSQRCIEWCFDRVEDDKYADQKYLDEMPKRFPGVVVINHKGANVAPWNYVNYRFSSRGGNVYVDDEPLVFFHFHGLKELQPWLIDTNLARSFRMPNAVMRRQVFGTYVNVLRAVSPNAPRTVSRRGEGRPFSFRGFLKSVLVTILSAVGGSYLIRVRGRVL